jgi:hypothetical protein
MIKRVSLLAVGPEVKDHSRTSQGDAPNHGACAPLIAGSRAYITALMEEPATHAKSATARLSKGGGDRPRSVTRPGVRDQSIPTVVCTA